MTASDQRAAAIEAMISAGESTDSCFLDMRISRKWNVMNAAFDALHIQQLNNDRNVADAMAVFDRAVNCIGYLEALLHVSGRSRPVEAGATFKPGDRVNKFSGDYRAIGDVRAAFTTRAGKWRYVVEFDAIQGCLQLRKIEK